MATYTLDFERPLLELERQIEELKRVAADKPDLAKAILDWAMTDEAAVAWAKTYAHPMKQVFGGLKLPGEATAQWLPESAYAHVGKLEAFPDLGQVADDWENKVLQ